MSKLTVPILVDWESIESYMAQNDIVHVVRCRDCKYYFGVGCDECEMMSARLAAYRQDIKWNDEFYCAFGERKDDENA